VKSKTSKAYKQAIQDLLSSTGVKICRPFPGLNLITSMNYEGAMLLAQGMEINKVKGTFRGSFLNLTSKEKKEFGQHLVEKAKEFCRRQDQRVYTSANIRDFKPNYIPIKGCCADCDAKNVELNHGSRCVSCVSKNNEARRGLGFCAGGSDCPHLGLVKKIHLKYTGKHLCDVCNNRIFNQEKGVKARQFKRVDPLFIPKAGDGNTFPVDGDTVTCDYILLDSNRRRLASSYYHKKELKFIIGRNEVIPGFESKILQMTVGEKKEFKVPSDEAFGPIGFGALIPPDADLVFRIHLISVVQPREEPAFEENSEDDDD